MRRKRITIGLLCISLILQTFAVTGCSRKEVKIYGTDNEVLAAVNNVSVDKMKLDDEGLCSYIDIVLQEAMEVLKLNEKELLQGQYHIYTAYDKNVYHTLKDTYHQYQKNTMSFGCAVTDAKGNLLATYSGGGNQENFANYATANIQPYAALEPLSVYAPAIENAAASWSKTYEDSPFKQIQEDGKIRDWPANASGNYSNQNITVYEALKTSYNTVAVKCLQDYGVQNSIQYLKDSFGISLAYEESRIQTMGEDEIIGNIALGYLNEGVSPVDMAGYYQSFASGGVYTEPKAIIKICDVNGDSVYEREAEGKQVMSYETAYVMNRLLQGTVSKGGTGEKANCGNIPVAGKTGAGNAGYWFVGTTPEYTCAMWHGRENMGNQATEMFRTAVSQFEHNEEIEFPDCKTVKTAAYCMESGKLITGKCKKVEKGYYTSIDATERCNQH